VCLIEFAYSTRARNKITIKEKGKQDKTPKTISKSFQLRSSLVPFFFFLWSCVLLTAD
jgi:hypothetical protein